MKLAQLGSVDLNLLKVFAAVHRERQITRASRALFISQSAVSHSLAKLRLLFDDPLFVRTPEGMQPTLLAERLAEPINQALQSVSAALQVNQRFAPADAAVEFTIGMTTLQPFHFLPEFYRSFEREAPLANLLVRTLQGGLPQALQALETGEIDLLLAVTQRSGERALESPRFMKEDLFDDPLVCVVSKDNDEVGARMDYATYARLPHLVMASDRVTRTWIDEALEKRGLQRRIAVTAPHPYAIPMLVGASRLVSTVARSLVATLAEDRNLRLLAPPFSGRLHVFRMIWSARTDRDLALEWLRRLVRDSCRTAQARLRTPIEGLKRSGRLRGSSRR